jgi:hypothetical protein
LIWKTWAPLDHLADGHLIEPMGMPKVFGVFLGQVTQRDNSEFLAIDFTQKSKRGLAQPHRAFKHRVEYRQEIAG